MNIKKESLQGAKDVYKRAKIGRPLKEVSQITASVSGGGD